MRLACWRFDGWTSWARLGAVSVWLVVLAASGGVVVAADFGVVSGKTESVPSSSGAAGVTEPESYKMDNYRSPVPATLKGARVVDTGEAEALWDNGKGQAVFIDVYPAPPKPNLPKGTVWREPKHISIKGAVWLGNVGFGVLAPKFESYFRAGLEKLSGGDMGKPLVFFCLRECWMSWNAAKRAMAWGYTNVIWYPDGSDGWGDLGLPLVNLKPEE